MSNSSNKRYSERLRDKIQCSKAAAKLLEYVEAHPEDAPDIMTPHQANVALALIKKVAPDLSQATLEVKDDRENPRAMSMLELQAEWDKKNNVIEHESNKQLQ